MIRFIGVPASLGQEQKERASCDFENAVKAWCATKKKGSWTLFSYPWKDMKLANSIASPLGKTWIGPF